MHRPRLVITILFASVSLALFSHWTNQRHRESCAYDGIRIRPVFAVDVTWEDQRQEHFCSIRCAHTYLEQEAKNHRPRLHSIMVRDEVTGDAIDARRAIFVKSRIISVPTASNDIHAFGDTLHAISHAEKYQGKPLENPFQKFLNPPPRLEEPSRTPPK